MPVTLTSPPNQRPVCGTMNPSPPASRITENRGRSSSGPSARATPIDMAVKAISKSAPTARSILDRSSIATRLVIFAVGLVGVTATSIGALSFTRARGALEADARTGLVLLARDVAAHVQDELENRAADITHWSRLEVMRALIYEDVDKELAKFLEQTLHERAAYRAIVALDATGRRVAGAGAVDEIEPDGAGDTVRVSNVPRAGRATARLQNPVFNPHVP